MRHLRCFMAATSRRLSFILKFIGYIEFRFLIKGHKLPGFMRKLPRIPILAVPAFSGSYAIFTFLLRMYSMSNTQQFSFESRPLVPFAHDYAHGASEPWHSHNCAQLLHTLSGVVHVQTEHGSWIVPQVVVFGCLRGLATAFELRVMLPPEPFSLTLSPAQTCLQYVRWYKFPLCSES